MLAAPMLIVQIGGNRNADRHATDRTVGHPASDPFSADGCDCGSTADSGGERLRGIWDSRWRLRRESVAGSRGEKTERHGGAVRHRFYHLEPCQAAGVAG